MKRPRLAAPFVALGAVVLLCSTAWTASHSDAPLSKLDRQTNISDVYAFVGRKYNNPATRVLNVVVAFNPFGEPGDGVMYDRFSDDVLHSIHIAHPSTGETLVRYDFRFSSTNPQAPPGLKNPDTILSYGRGTAIGPIQAVGGPQQNYTQAYTLTRTVGAASAVIGSNLLTPPPNVGGNTAGTNSDGQVVPLRGTTPFYNDPDGRAVSGAATFAALDTYTRQTIYDLPTGEACFAGPREDGFFADTPAIFDLLNPRFLGVNAQNNDTGVDGFKGFNVLVFALQVPLSQLPSLPYTSPFFGPKTGVGVFATMSRQRLCVLSTTGEPQFSGPWVQVNRMGNPLFNEVLVRLRDKNRYLRTLPPGDASFAVHASTPELPVLINATFQTGFATTNRNDLVAVYIPDVLRVNTASDPVRLSGDAGFSPLGFLGGDTVADGTAAGDSGEWPNGRRLGGDVLDVALTAIASGPGYQPPLTFVGDNKRTNDVPYHRVFPYAATPHAGPTNRKDP